MVNISLLFFQNSQITLKFESLLEEDVSDLEDNVASLDLDIQDLRTENNNQDHRLNILDDAVIENTNDISGQYNSCSSIRNILQTPLGVQRNKTLHK